jgi:hypothetical protein
MELHLGRQGVGNSPEFSTCLSWEIESSCDRSGVDRYVQNELTASKSEYLNLPNGESEFFFFGGKS